MIAHMHSLTVNFATRTEVGRNSIYAKSYQAVTVTEGHSAGLGLVLQMPHILAAR